MSESDAQCALNVDGSLKDAKDMVFYNDPDDTVPLSAPSSAQPASSTSTTPTGLDTFSVLLQTGRKPAPLTAGSRCSICTSKPSACLCDADNACSSTSRKCALSSATEQLVRKKVVLQLSAPLSDNELAGADTDIDTDLGAPGAGQSDEAEDEDAPDKPEDKPEDLLDTTLRAALSKTERTADVRTIFTCDSKHWVYKPCNKYNLSQRYLYTTHAHLSLHSLQYPTLACIAQDYLPIQGSSVLSEQAFSSGGITSTVLKGAYRNGHLSAAVEAEGHAALLDM
ncbi:hypothetical protein DFJ58DRAFT_733810 [Suillus subalutaceus]|uniref:uncharacterized protein n=1 Tax=Suillus subalutaceus TaxID=48586 RepID=UPI001B883AA2|nr:uncharacterized protein DFJ58DRAFT_733810 [Suillus subalutaceus]KAG1838436.1 hypothetical protein DFJ58DRAFT_733810 [Suillus subalutaceus]